MSLRGFGLALWPPVIVLTVMLYGCGVVVTGDATIDIRMHLPNGVEGYVSVTGPDGTEQVVTRSVQWRGAAAGSYTFRAEQVVVGGIRFFPFPALATVMLADGGRTTVTIAYGLAAGGHLVPDDGPADVRPGSRAFHVDCVAGDDGRSGLSVGEAWRSLGRLSGLVLEAGDRVLLRRGCEWVGPLRVPWSGSAEWPVVVGAYGEGARPVVRDSGLNHVDISGSYVIVEHLHARTTPGTVWEDPACAMQPVGWRTGFTIQHEARHVTIRHSRAEGNTAGVHVTRGASHNRIVHNELVGNVIMSVNTNDGGFDDSGAWGIVLNGTDNQIAYNYFSGNRAWCSYDFGIEGASVEVYEAQRNVIHHNLSVDDYTFSELGSSSRREARDNVYAYNRYVSSLPVSQFLVLRGAGAHFGPTPGTRAFHNTVYLSNPDQSQGVVCYSGCGPDMLELRNNILWVEWKGVYADAAFAESNNVYWRSDGRPLLQFFGAGSSMSASSLIADPRFSNAAGGDLTLRSDSPAIGAGAPLDLGFERDATGVPLPIGTPPSIGAHEHTH